MSKEAILLVKIDATYSRVFKKDGVLINWGWKISDNLINGRRDLINVGMELEKLLI